MKSRCQLPLLEVQLPVVIVVLQMDGKVKEDSLDEIVDLADLEEGGVAVVSHLEHLVLLVLDRHELHELLRHVEERTAVAARLLLLALFGLVVVDKSALLH